jgi:hypothetical protein
MAKSNKVSPMPAVVSDPPKKTIHHKRSDAFSENVDLTSILVSPKASTRVRIETDYVADKDFLDNESFRIELFSGQQSSLFSSEATPLREELGKIFTKKFSGEHYQFLIDIQKLNSNKNVSPQELENKVLALEKKYVTLGATDQLNLSDDTLLQVTNSPKTLASYRRVVAELVTLIQTNLTPDEKERLKNIDKQLPPRAVVLSHAAEDMVKKLKSFIGTTQQKYSAFFQNFIYREPTVESVIFNFGQKSCKDAMQDLNKLLKSKSLHFDREFSGILSKLYNSLERDHRSLLANEFKNSTSDIRSKTIEGILNHIHTVEENLNLPKIPRLLSRKPTKEGDELPVVSPLQSPRAPKR